MPGIKAEMEEAKLALGSQDFDRAKDICKTRCFAAHPGGTVKVGDVVDSDLQTELQNLYVCDCSVIPEAWGLPPTLTLIGLGKRLAKHLATARERTIPAPAPDPTGIPLAAQSRG